MKAITQAVQAENAAASLQSPPIDQESRSLVIVGTLPRRKDTVRAAVLAALLESSELTGMESVFEQSTTRLSAVVHALETDYGWSISRRELVVDTKDGRTVSIVAYSLPPATIEQALAMGARPWIDEVKAARAELKQSALIKKKQQAAQAKAIRSQQRRLDPRQLSLWGVA